MARIRTVKPEMALDEDLARCSEAAQLLAIRILNHSDDEGYFKANARLVRAACFPLMDYTDIQVEKLIRELRDIEYVVLFTGTDDKQYGWVRTFTEHQRINRPSDSKIRNHCTITEDSMNIQGALTLGKEGKGRERKGGEGPPMPAEQAFAEAQRLFGTLGMAGSPEEIASIVGQIQSLVGTFFDSLEKRGTRLSEDWQPDFFLIEWALNARPDLDIAMQVERFKNYWIAKSGQSATKVDWDRTFKNWIIDEGRKHNGTATGRQHGQSPAERNLEASRRHHGEGDGPPVAKIA